MADNCRFGDGATPIGTRCRAAAFLAPGRLQKFTSCDSTKKTPEIAFAFSGVIMHHF